MFRRFPCWSSAKRSNATMSGTFMRSASMRSASGLGMASKPAAAQPDGMALAADDAAAAQTLDFVGLLAAPARHIRLSVGALQYGELRERQLAAMTFAFLAKRSRELCNSISELQGILPLTWSLTAYAAEPETLRSCLVALRYLARFAAYANAVAEKGGTPPLVALIDSEHAGVRLDAAACAAALCEHDEVGSLMIDAGVVPAAKRLATAEEEELQHWGMAIVAHLAAANPKNRYVLMEAELLPQMLTLCRPRVAAQPISPVQRQTQQQALRALDAICTMPEAVAALNGLTDFFPLLFELRDDSDPLVSPHPGHWHPGHWPSPSPDPHHSPSPPSTHHSPLDLHPDAAPTLNPTRCRRRWTASRPTGRRSTSAGAGAAASRASRWPSGCCYPPTTRGRASRTARSRKARGPRARRPESPSLMRRRCTPQSYSGCRRAAQAVPEPIP